MYKPILQLAILLAAVGGLRAAELKGWATLKLRPDPGNPTLTFDANVFNNELIFIITDTSNAAMTITNIFDPVLTPLDKNPTAMVDTPLEISDTNPCKGETLQPGGVCAFSVLFDTSGVNDGASDKWQIGEQISVAFLTRPFKTRAAIPWNKPLNVVVTVQNPAASSDVSAVPEPRTMLGVGLVVVGMVRRRLSSRPG